MINHLVRFETFHGAAVDPSRISVICNAPTRWAENGVTPLGILKKVNITSRDYEGVQSDPIKIPGASITLEFCKSWVDYYLQYKGEGLWVKIYYARKAAPKKSDYKIIYIGKVQRVSVKSGSISISVESVKALDPDTVFTSRAANRFPNGIAPILLGIVNNVPLVKPTTENIKEKRVRVEVSGNSETLYLPFAAPEFLETDLDKYSTYGRGGLDKGEIEADHWEYSRLHVSWGQTTSKFELVNDVDTGKGVTHPDNSGTISVKSGGTLIRGDDDEHNHARPYKIISFGADMATGKVDINSGHLNFPAPVIDIYEAIRRIIGVGFGVDDYDGPEITISGPRVGRYPNGGYPYGVYDTESKPYPILVKLLETVGAILILRPREITSLRQHPWDYVVKIYPDKRVKVKGSIIVSDMLEGLTCETVAPSKKVKRFAITFNKPAPRSSNSQYSSYGLKRPGVMTKGEGLYFEPIGLDLEIDKDGKVVPSDVTLDRLCNTFGADDAEADGFFYTPTDTGRELKLTSLESIVYDYKILKAFFSAYSSTCSGGYFAVSGFIPFYRFSNLLKVMNSDDFIFTFDTVQDLDAFELLDLVEFDPEINGQRFGKKGKYIILNIDVLQGKLVLKYFGEL